jgi:hypothetical protein
MIFSITIQNALSKKKGLVFFLFSLKKHCDGDLLYFSRQFHVYRVVWFELFELSKDFGDRTSWKVQVMYSLEQVGEKRGMRVWTLVPAAEASMSFVS